MKRVALTLLLAPSIAAAQEATTSSLLPIDLPDAERKVIVDFQLGFNPVFTGITGDPDTIGVIPTEGLYEDRNMFLDGRAALGARGLFWPTLNVYGLGSGTFDLQGRPATRAPETAIVDAPAVHPSVAHRYVDARALYLHLAYAEIDGITEDGFLGDLHLRAGRQFHFSRVGLTFDGITAGYDGPNAKATVRVGSRSSTFDRTQDDSGFLDGGFLVGGDLGWDFGELLPLSIEAEVMHYRRSIQLMERDQGVAGGSEAELVSTLGELRIEYVPIEKLILTAIAEFTFPAISHVRVGASFDVAGLGFLIDFDQKIGEDIFYDLGAGRGIDFDGRRTTYETLRLNLTDPQPYSDLRALVLIPLASWLEIEPNAGFRVAYGSDAESSPFDATHVRYGLTGFGNFRLDEGNGLEAQVGFDGLVYFRGDDDGTFRDRNAGGERLAHSIFGGVRYVRGGGFRGRRLLSERSLSIGVQGFLRLTRIDNRHLSVAAEERVFGAGADAAWQFTPYSAVRVGYELARDSGVFYDYLDLFHAVYASLRASF